MAKTTRLPDDPPQTLNFALAAIRRHLGMEVAYISEFDGDLTIFRNVDAPGLEHLIKPGDVRSLDDVYCRHILEGRLPELIPDTSLEPIARAMPITSAVPIGSHVSVPIRDESGTAVGMLCCLSARPNEALTRRDLDMLHIFSDVLGRQIADQITADRIRKRRATAVKTVIDEKAFSCVYQPIWNLNTMRPVGLEALARFSARPSRPPNEWFADAADAGLGVELELAVMATAIKALDEMPRGIYLSLNASPAAILGNKLPGVLAEAPPERLLLEVTEHAIVDNYDDLIAALAPLRARGIRIAIDDAGAGYATLQHILRLDPDRIKLDMSLTRALDKDPARRALVSAMVQFARQTNATLIAEGIETKAELGTLVALGVPKGQGYFLGRPTELAAALALVREPPVLPAPETGLAQFE